MLPQDARLHSLKPWCTARKGVARSARGMSAMHPLVCMYLEGFPSQARAKVFTSPTNPPLSYSLCPLLTLPARILPSLHHKWQEQRSAAPLNSPCRHSRALSARRARDSFSSARRHVSIPQVSRVSSFRRYRCLCAI